jgi:hypothetical protein
MRNDNADNAETIGSDDYVGSNSIFFFYIGDRIRDLLIC